MLALALVLLLVELAWGSLWVLAVGTDWFRPLAEGWPPCACPAPDRPARRAPLTSLPYTQPDSPGGRLFRWLGQLLGWWRDAFWPVAGSALLGFVAAAALAAVLSLLLPDRLRPLNVALVALIGPGVVWRWRGRRALLGQALVQVGLGWLAGNAAFAEVTGPSLGLAMSFVLAAWGMLRVVEGQPSGLWLLNGGQVAGAAWLVVLKQPLPAGAMGLLLFGQVAMQPSLRFGCDAARIAFGRRGWPWLMVAMPLAALALP